MIAKDYMGERRENRENEKRSTHGMHENKDKGDGNGGKVPGRW